MVSVQPHGIGYLCGRGAETTVDNFPDAKAFFDSQVVTVQESEFCRRMRDLIGAFSFAQRLRSDGPSG